MGHLVDRRPVVRVRGAGGPGAAATRRPDQLAVEAPLTLKVGEQTIATTMRTPGHDLELALGWLVAEGVARSSGDLTELTSCDADTVRIGLAPGVQTPQPRLGATSSACGVCGSDSIAEVLSRRPLVGVVSLPIVVPQPLGGREVPPADGHRSLSVEPLVDAGVLVSLPDRLREAQRAFDRTGGLHAAGLFTPAGELLCVREDVGRHNAVDKVIGWALTHGLLPATDKVLQVSGRASFELTQKATMAGIPLLSAVSAPSTLAVDLADEAGLTLAGFVRGDSMNLYTHPGRVRVEVPATV
ncbi:formate dehydrogenase accessory sulfurtransferase FdhD [Kineosporia rhizophila]|uniref:formate dehydrogenase accessory sulfurtransferase FdhD n=1 Tax=Kineosporia TaxID=49184 RepID=UPI001E2D3495|nr:MULTISPECIES: formate dehydrogenase accessory sulfurtransferase FdhD [Kineosporia]MCE0535070.1 formate dehydrogenase accessory sulfurtransferase FdhD [Kineosporia rhizophila]